MKSDRPRRHSAASSAPKSNGDAASNAPATADHKPATAVHDHDIVTTVEASSRLHTFVDMMRAAGLSDLLRTAGPFTVFAPSDRAFARIPQPQLDALMADTTRLRDVMHHHVVKGRVRAPTPDRPRVAAPIVGGELQLTSQTDAYRVDEARLVQTNLRASNGVVHVIDRVLLPA